MIFASALGGFGKTSLKAGAASLSVFTALNAR